jgi:hypothetical protein
MFCGRGDKGVRWMGGRIPRGSRAAILTAASAVCPEAEAATPVVTSHTARAMGIHAPADLEIPDTLVSMIPPEVSIPRPGCLSTPMSPPPAPDTTFDEMNYVILVEFAVAILPQMNTSFKCS